MENQEEVIILTPEGHQKMLSELEHLKRDHREEIRERMANIQKRGEVSEDPEYEEVKKDQALLEGRIATLENILQKCKVLTSSEISTDRVGIGSKVKVKNLKTKGEEQYTILSTMESDPAKDRISDVSPVGRALMRAKKGDMVEALTPSGKAKYLILSIKKNDLFILKGRFHRIPHDIECNNMFGVGIVRTVKRVKKYFVHTDKFIL